MNYLKKYLKYKTKYLNLLNEIITGGMSERHIQTGEITTYLFPYYKVNNWTDLMLKIREDNNINNKEKINLLENELGDIIQLFYDKDNIDEPNKILANNIIEQIKTELINYYNVGLIELDLIEVNAQNIIYDNNPHYDMVNIDAIGETENGKINNIDITRGNISEKITTHKQRIKLSVLDNDNSKGFNTKDFRAYNNNFIDTLKNIIKISFDNKQNKNYINDYIINNIFRYVPIDIVKNNTIWEYKSLNDNIKNNNDIQTTKLYGFSLSNIFLGKTIENATMSFEFIFTSNGKKVQNIIFKLIGDKFIGFNNEGKKIYDPNGININIPILKENQDGYNYYWYMSNYTGDRYFSPLTNQDEKNNFLTKIKSLNIDITKINNADELTKILNDKNIDIDDITYYVNNFIRFQNNDKHYNYLIGSKTNDKGNVEQLFILPKKQSIKLPYSYTKIYSIKDEKISKYKTLFKLRTINNYYK